MVIPALATVAGHALCGAAVNTTCDECFEHLNQTVLKQDDDQDVVVSDTVATPPDGTLHANNKPRPTELIPQRRDSLTLIARPIATGDQTEGGDKTEVEEDNQHLKTTVHHQKDGENSVYEVRTCSLYNGLYFST